MHRDRTELLEPGSLAPLPPLLLDWLGSNMGANVGLTRLFLVCGSAAEARQTLELSLARLRRQGAAAAADRVHAIIELWQRLPQAYDIVTSVLAIEQQGTGHERGAVAQWSSVFDRAALISPEAGVALYSLGSSTLLEAATEEIVDRMRKWGLLSPDRVLLEIGCGIGRCIEKLAGAARLVVGVDISHRMLDHARARCAGKSDMGLVRSSGNDLAAFRDASFDVIYAVDTFPYLMRAGAEVAHRHIREARRLLKPEGSLLILNFSYRADIEVDRLELARIAAGTEFAVDIDGSREFTLWDGVTFLLRRTRARHLDEPANRVLSEHR